MLTVSVYSRLGVRDLAVVLDALPSVTGAASRAQTDMRDRNLRCSAAA